MLSGSACYKCTLRSYLGPKEAVSVAFVISCLRNMAGTGSLLAFPGSMIGAFLAGLAYRRWHNTGAAMLGEISAPAF